MHEAERFSEGEQSMIPRGQQGAALTIVIIMLGMFIVMSTPLCPTLSVTLAIDTKPWTPTLSVTSFSFERIPLPAALVITRDVPYLVGGPPTVGEAKLSFTVSYKNVLLSDKVFASLSDGTYQARVVYFPRSEERETPYVVSLTLVFKGQTVRTSVNIFP